MSRKLSSSKKPWEANRERYTWYLRPPFNHDFDRSHWWKGKEKQVKPVAALYELARRHPNVGGLLQKFQGASWYGHAFPDPIAGAKEKSILNQAIKDLGKESPALHCLCEIGLKSWPILSDSGREFWEMSARKMKGLDCRDEAEKCFSISRGAEGDVLGALFASFKHGKKGPFQFRITDDLTVGYSMAEAKRLILLHKRIEQKSLSCKEMDAALTRRVIAAYRRGYWIYAIAPDLTVEEAKSLFEIQYRRHQKAAEDVKQRARPSSSEDWLRLIVQFDNAASSSAGVNSRGFSPYKKAIDGIRFDRLV